MNPRIKRFYTRFLSWYARKLIKHIEDLAEAERKAHIRFAAKTLGISLKQVLRQGLDKKSGLEIIAMNETRKRGRPVTPDEIWGEIRYTLLLLK